MITPADYSLCIEQGSTFDYTWTWTAAGSPVNLSGCTARMQGRTSPDATTTIFEMTTENGGITLGGAAGTITWILTAAQTALITQSGVYDLEIVFASGVVRKLLKGSFTLIAEVTK